MADDTTAAVIPLHQLPPKKKDGTKAQRAKADRPRKKQKAVATAAVEPELSSSESLIPPEKARILTQLAALSASATNSITNPNNILPTTSTMNGLAPGWWPHCVSHLQGRWIEDGKVWHWVLREAGGGEGP